jgi:dsDNA-binding SOS-regulon protein
MAVITKYVVVRNGVELDKEFLIKKEADAYDKMLDAAENLAGYIKDAELKIDVNDETIDAISIFLAKNGPEVSRILRGLKPVVPVEKPTDGETKEKEAVTSKPAPKKKAPAAKTKPRRR